MQPQALFGIVDNLAAAKILRRCLYGLAAVGAGVRRPPLPASDDRPDLDEDASFSFGYLLEDLSASSKVYVPHPSRAGAGAGEQLASSTLANRYTPPPKEAELALLRMRNVSMQRGDKARTGYEGPAHITSWAAGDMLGALDRSFPEVEAPTARDLWSVACAGFAASRSVLFVSDLAIEGTMEMITEHVALSNRSTRPMVLLGAQGSGKSAIIAHWASRFATALGQSASADAARVLWLHESLASGNMAALISATDVMHAYSKTVLGKDVGSENKHQGADVSDLPSSRPRSRSGAGLASKYARGGRSQGSVSHDCVIYRSQPVAPSCLLFYDGACPTLLITVYCGEGGTPRFGWELILMIAGEIETAVVALIGQRTGGFSQMLNGGSHLKGGAANQRRFGQGQEASSTPKSGPAGSASGMRPRRSSFVAAGPSAGASGSASSGDSEIDSASVTEEDAGKVVAAAAAIRDALLSGDPPTAVARAFLLLLRRAALAGVRLIMVLDGVEHLDHTQPLFSATGAMAREQSERIESASRGGGASTRLAGMRAALKEARDLAERRASIDVEEHERIKRMKRVAQRGKQPGLTKPIRRSSLAGEEPSQVAAGSSGQEHNPHYVPKDPSEVASRTRSAAKKGMFGRRRSSVVLLDPLGDDADNMATTAILGESPRKSARGGHPGEHRGLGGHSTGQQPD